MFAFVHLLLLAGAVGYTLLSLVQGNYPRFGILSACLIAYYFLVLHKPVRKEIERKRHMKSKGEKSSKP